MVTPLPRKINVLEMHASLGAAGGQRNMITFARYLNRDIFNVFVASYRTGGPYERVLGDAGIPYLVGDGTAEKILRFIQEKQIDVVHIHRSGGSVPLETALIHGARLLHKNMVIVEKNVFGKYDPTCVDVIDCSLFQSMMQIHERYLPASGLSFNFKRMKVFYNMVDAAAVKQYRLSEAQFNQEKQRLGIAADRFVIGKIARPDVAKWSDLLLAMMPYAVRLIPNLVFIIIGTPPSRVRRIIKSPLHKHFILLPETADEQAIHTFYQLIDVLAHSSKIGECNGNTINEALYWGKPVVTNSTPQKDNGQLEQVNHLVNGIIANHPQTFARALAYLYREKDKQMAMGRNGHEKVIRVNNPHDITRRLEKLFLEKLVEKGMPAAAAVLDAYRAVAYHPSEQETLGYRSEYQRRLHQEFDVLYPKERFMNVLRLPVNLFYKIKDFIDHKRGV